MGKSTDLTGQRFGKLTVIRKEENAGVKGTSWLCRCDCGNEKVVKRELLQRGKTKSCGCLYKEQNVKSARDREKVTSKTEDVIRPIKGYEGKYWVTKSGLIINRKGEAIKEWDNGYGYMVVELRINNTPKKHKVHRIVAENFIDNPNNYKEVNHKDEDKHNNRMSNLEWCDSKYNKRYGTGRERRSEGMKKVWKERKENKCNKQKEKSN